MTDCYAELGNSTWQGKFMLIHTAFAQTVDAFRAASDHGMNVTSPFWHAVFIHIF